MLCHETMRQIDSVCDDDIMAFIHITNKTLDIDSHYRSTITTATCQPSHSINHPRAAPPTAPSIVPPTTTLPPTAMTPIGSTLNCSNCHGQSHTVDTCFKAGGGLEGQHDKYQANRTCAQAHLAHLDEAIANRQQVQVFLVCMEDILDGNDFVSTMTLPSPDIVVASDSTPVVDIPDMTAFSAIPFSSTNVFTSPVNDNLFFEAYSLSLSLQKEFNLLWLSLMSLAVFELLWEHLAGCKNLKKC